MFRNTSELCRGNACFYGYAIDLLARMAADLGFRYTLYEVPDGHYGSLNEYTRQWDGMVKELIPGKNGLTVSSLNPEWIITDPGKMHLGKLNYLLSCRAARKSDHTCVPNSNKTTFWQEAHRPILVPVPRGGLSFLAGPS